MMVLRGTSSPKGLATRDRILSSAIKRFAAEGFQASSVAQIARDAGLTPPAVHAHFGTKEALFIAAFERDIEGMLGVLTSRLTGDVLRPRQVGRLSELLAEIERHPLVYRVFQGREPERTAPLLELPSVQAVLSQLVDLLRSAQQSGLVRNDFDPSVLGGAVMTLMLTLLLGAVQIGPIGGEEQRAAIAAIIATGVLAR
jgi:AcrR family transcriptional regulator